jgi:hypothetical protein
MRDTFDMAREAGFDVMRLHGVLPHVPKAIFIANVCVTEEVEHLVALVRADERAAHVQEPVGEVVVESMGVRGSDAMRVRMHFYKEIPPVGSKIYTTPPAAPMPLTDEQIDTAWLLNGGGLAANRYYDFARAIEAAHGITGKGQP